MCQGDPFLNLNAMVATQKVHRVFHQRGRAASKRAKSVVGVVDFRCPHAS